MTLYTTMETAGITMKKITKMVMSLRSESGSIYGDSSSPSFLRFKLSSADERLSRLLAIELLTAVTQNDIVFGYALMEPKLLLSAHKPLFVSCNSRFNEKPHLSVKSPLPISTIRAARSQFMGEGLILGNKYGFWSGSKKTRVVVEPVRAAVKRRKELPFDNVVQRDKKLKLVLSIRKILVSQTDRIMSLRGLGKYRRDLGLKKRRRFIALLRKYPGVFEIVEEGAFSLRFKMTSEAERLYLEEMKIRNELEGLLVVKLRKLVMMSLEKRILLEKISHLRTDLGLPLEFRDTICQRYPQYFRVVPTPRGPALELTHWDPEVAVSAAELSEEDNKVRESEERNLIIDRPPKFNRVKLPRGLNLSKSETRKICQFRDMAYVSPYKDFSHLRSGTLEKEKHACGVIHELLSLTTEKRTLVDHLTHFREEFRFSQQLRGMLIRHPDLFYVSLKGERDSVFLREAYRNSELIDKDPLTLVKEKMRALVSVPRFPRRGRGPKRDEEEETDGTDVEGEEEEEESDDEEWSDVDGYLEGEDGDGDWTDDEGEEDVPPNFDDEDEDEDSVKLSSSRKSTSPRKKEEKVLTPVFPDGTPREKW